MQKENCCCEMKITATIERVPEKKWKEKKSRLKTEKKNQNVIEISKI